MGSTHDKAAELARIDGIERGDADADTLAAAWRDAKNFQLNLRTRLRRAVARSASLPPRVAADVLQRFPEDLLSNPALPLLLLETPDLLLRAPARFWTAVLAASEISPALMPALVAACPPSRLGRLTERREFEPADAPTMLRRLRGASVNSVVPELDLTDAQCLSLCRQWHEPMLDLDAALLAALRARTDDFTVRLMLMRARQLDAAQALAIIPKAQARQYYESLALAGRDDLPLELMTTMARREPGPVRVLICANPGIPDSLLLELVKDRAPDVAAAAMLHPRLPRSAWQTYLKRGSTTRRAVLAARPDLLPEEFATLAQAGEALVRAAVAQNPHAPAETLAQLADDLHDGVREALLANPSYRPETPAPQGDRSTEAEATPPRRRAAKPSVLDEARKLLVGDTSGGAKWEPVLQWVALGGERPLRVTMSAQDRRKVLRVGLKLLGEDPADLDDLRTRLLVALCEGLGCMPELNSKLHRALSYGPREAVSALAERWMSRLQSGGYSEAQALALLCFTRTAMQHGRDRGVAHRPIAAAALRARISRALTLFDALPRGKPRDNFAEDLLDHLLTLEYATPEGTVLRVAAWSHAPLRATLGSDCPRRLATAGGMEFIDALEAHDPALAQSFLRGVDLSRTWQLPPEVFARAQAAQGLRPTS